MGSLEFQTKIRCYNCNTYQTYIRPDSGRPRWSYKLGLDKPLCFTCYQFLFTNGRYPERYRQKKRVHSRLRKGFRYAFLGKNIRGTMRLSGYCSQCPNNVFDNSCKKTDMHHWIYITCLPWFGRIELCNKCHRNKHRGMDGKFIKGST